MGAFTIGQAQFGELTIEVVVQPFTVAIKVTWLPVLTLLITLFVLSTEPDVLVVVPLLLKCIL